MEDRDCSNPRQFLLKGSHTDLFELTPSELQSQGSRFKGMWGRTKLSTIRVRAGRKLSPRQNCWQRPLFLFCAFPAQSQQADAISETPSTWLTCLTHPDDSLKCCPTQLSSPPKLFPVAFHVNGLLWPMLGISLNFLKQAASGFHKPCTSH